ncbi:EAL domain-containing response regulator [Leptolyngbya iicbica]|uniref:EAL domain-containing protein n=2 Tax=Cyanophyceae TaxID=3028117 RepID=A0A4V2E1X9_9CYAN|nr:EAL domain-containing protein [Leptolyngbya sp. LK]RZM75694.1 EAL domain-containing protein [Leptolyngbya sp. LK]
MPRCTVLVVEDEVVIAMDLQATLIKLGYDVPTIATSGEDAIHQAIALQPDIVLMDIHLGQGLDGIDAAQQIVETLEIPIVYLTAYADEATLTRARTTLPFGYVLKPFEPRELKANLEIAFHKHQFDQLLKDNQQWLLGVLTSISEGVAATDAEGLIKFLNPVAEALTGWSEAEAIGKSPEEVLRLVHEFSQELVENPVMQALKRGTIVNADTSMFLANRAGDTIPVIPSTGPIQTSQGQIQGAVVVFRDMSEQHQLQAQLEHNAMHDSLTQLPNRALLFDRLQLAIERAQRSPTFGFAVMLLDIDRFKFINDTFGHTVGDQVLVAVAPRLLEQLRSVDTVARLGGDEFAILLEDVTDPNVALKTAQRIIHTISQPLPLTAHTLQVTSSLGIVLSTPTYTNASDLLRDADIAMYQAKASGGNGCELFDSSIHHQAKDRIQQEQELRRAIAQADFQVYYQPIVDLATRQLVSAEALIRWQKPGSGLVPPDEFIPLAEELGLIAPIDQWVLQTASRQLQAWQQLQPENAPPLKISINLSSQQINQNASLNELETVLQTLGSVRQHLRLEVTESVFIKNIDRATELFQRFQAWGMQICLDDFGTGYSSLSYLHRLPIDGVKIDRSFVAGMDSDPNKLAIVRAIVGLCHTLNKAVIAEGIENHAQRRLLMDLGCQQGQGYLFAPPLPADQIPAWLDTDPATATHRD